MTTYVSAKLDPEYKQELIALLKENKDCFAWQYYEMSGLERKLVEHHLPIKPRYRPYKQAPSRIKPEVMADVKAEITRYMKQNLFNSVSMPNGFLVWILCVRKNGKVRVCIDFRDLYKGTPMDSYPMPVADMLVDAAARHKVIMVEEDIRKTAFTCPSALGLYE
jgi:hypothetical protein